MTKAKLTPADHRLIRAAKEAVAYAKGEADPKGYRLHTPAEIEARALRVKMRLTQKQFAERFGLDVATLRDWEQGRRIPRGAAAVLLRVIAREPAAVERALSDKPRARFRREPAHA